MSFHQSPPYLCVVCKGHDDGMGVGDHRRISWHCRACGPERAKVIHHMDKKSLDEVKMNFFERRAVKILLKKVKGTDIEKLLKNSGLVK